MVGCWLSVLGCFLSFGTLREWKGFCAGRGFANANILQPNLQLSTLNSQLSTLNSQLNIIHWTALPLTL
jgi:hypothetical protein